MTPGAMTAEQAVAAYISKRPEHIVCVRAGEWERASFHLAFGDLVYLVLSWEEPVPDGVPIPVGTRPAGGICVRVVNEFGEEDYTERLFNHP